MCFKENIFVMSQTEQTVVHRATAKYLNMVPENLRFYAKQLTGLQAC